MEMLVFLIKIREGLHKEWFQWQFKDEITFKMARKMASLDIGMTKGNY